jgi:hypothetical protein
VVLLLALSLIALCSRAGAQPWRNVDVAESHQIAVGGAVLQVDFARGALDLSHETILEHVRAAASAVTAYYGRFPVARARLLLIPVDGRDGILQGTTWGDVGGFQGFTRIRIGQHTTAEELAQDWTTTHEMVHLAFPSLPKDEHWMEEGQATYIEPVARVMTGELKAADVWRDMVRDMAKGEPQEGDQGLDHTHTWARTYWGGALFCLDADVAIRRETGNKKGLQDALRAVVAAGGTIDHDWDLETALEIGDRATGTHVLTQMYAAWSHAPVEVDLAKLWDQLGIRATPDGVGFAASAPMARIRETITGAALKSGH